MFSRICAQLRTQEHTLLYGFNYGITRKAKATLHIVYALPARQVLTCISIRTPYLSAEVHVERVVHRGAVGEAPLLLG